MKICLILLKLFNSGYINLEYYIFTYYFMGIDFFLIKSELHGWNLH